jgi:hypothetical protein
MVKLKERDSTMPINKLEIPYLSKGVCLKTYFLYIGGKKIFSKIWKKKFFPSSLALLGIINNK